MDESEEAVEWDERVPPTLLRAIEDQITNFVDWEDEGPTAYLARFLDEPTPPYSGYDAKHWIRERLHRLSAKETYQLAQRLLDGSYDHDHEVSQSLAERDIPLEMLDGRFIRVDKAAKELEVSDLVREPNSLLDGKFTAARKPWTEAQQALADQNYEVAVAQAVNALESVVCSLSGRKKISEGLARLFVAERKPLYDAINQLHNYGSAMPQVRHGSAQLSKLTPAEARAVCRASAAWICMLLELDDLGVQFPM